MGAPCCIIGCFLCCLCTAWKFHKHKIPKFAAQRDITCRGISAGNQHFLQCRTSNAGLPSSVLREMVKWTGELVWCLIVVVSFLEWLHSSVEMRWGTMRESIDRSQLWASIRMPPGCLPIKVLQACPSVRRPWGTPRTHRRNYKTHLTWECLKIPPGWTGNSCRGRGMLGIPWLLCCQPRYLEENG